MVDRVTAPLVVKIRDKAAQKHGRRFGNYVKTVLALTFAWGLERGYVKINPALKVKGIRRPRGVPEANRPWTDAERDAVMDALAAHMRLPGPTGRAQAAARGRFRWHDRRQARQD
jgi:hypothetical protein